MLIGTKFAVVAAVLAAVVTAADPLVGIGLVSHPINPKHLEFMMWEIDPDSGVATKTRLNDTVSCSSYGSDYYGSGEWASKCNN
jgi:hypothetical protein